MAIVSMQYWIFLVQRNCQEMYVVPIKYFSQDSRRFKECCQGILLTFNFNDVINRISTSLIKIIVFLMMSH